MQFIMSENCTSATKMYNNKFQEKNVRSDTEGNQVMEASGYRKSHLVFNQRFPFWLLIVNSLRTAGIIAVKTYKCYV